jgi:hypothetical protein
LSYDAEAAERVRQLLSARDDVVEKPMVGGLSFLVNDNMCCGITVTALMVRVGAERRAASMLTSETVHNHDRSPRGLALGNSGPIRCCQHQAATTPESPV